MLSTPQRKRLQVNDLSSLGAPGLPFIEPFLHKLDLIRLGMGPDEWRQFAKSDPSLLQWRLFLSADPYTQWGLQKPRGYAGDATLMDFAYGHAAVGDMIDTSSPTGREIYKFTSSAQQAESARLRLKLICDELAQYALTDPGGGVTSFASGHARELEALPAATKEKLGLFTAIDLDAEALKTAQRSAWGMPFMSARRNAVTGDMSDLQPSGLVYSLGLFDYLPDAYAQRILRKMWELTRSGGSLVVANLATDAANLGYCEAIMDWWMVTRDADRMQALGRYLKRTEMAVGDITVTRQGCFNYLKIVKQTRS